MFSRAFHTSARLAVKQTPAKNMGVLFGQLGVLTRFDLLSLKALKAECRARLLKVSGRKLDLLTRLNMHELQRTMASSVDAVKLPTPADAVVEPKVPAASPAPVSPLLQGKRHVDDVTLPNMLEELLHKVTHSDAPVVLLLAVVNNSGDLVSLGATTVDNTLAALNTHTAESVDPERAVKHAPQEYPTTFEGFVAALFTWGKAPVEEAVEEAAKVVAKPAAPVRPDYPTTFEGFLSVLFTFPAKL